MPVNIQHLFILNPFDDIFQTSSSQWNSKDLTLPSTDIVALIQWIPRLTKATLPEAIVDRLVGGKGPLVPRATRGMDPDDLADLVQWSDLIVFDFLTGNYDRVASMMVRILCIFFCETLHLIPMRMDSCFQRNHLSDIGLHFLCTN